MAEENKTRFEDLIARIDEHIITRHRRRYESQVRYHHRQSALLKRRHGEHTKILRRLASEAGLDLDRYEEEHRKGLKARKNEQAKRVND